MLIDSAQAALGGLSETGGKMGFSTAQQNSDIAGRAGQYLGVAISFIGVLFLIYAIYGGYLWMTAQGDSKKVDEAKGILKRAVVGIIIIVSAYSISAFVGSFTSDLNEAPAPDAPQTGWWTE